MNCSKHIIYAVAVYICKIAHEQDLFTKEVNTDEISKIYGATKQEQEEAYCLAKTFLRDFL